MNFELRKALLSLLFYTDDPYFFTTFSKFLSLLFPYFLVEEHLKIFVLSIFECLFYTGFTVFSILHSSSADFHFFQVEETAYEYILDTEEFTEILDTPNQPSFISYCVRHRNVDSLLQFAIKNDRYIYSA